MDVRKVGFLVHDNQYGSKRRFTKGLAAAFERRGISTFTIDTPHGELSQDDIDRIQREKPDFLATFSQIVPGLKGGFLCDELQIPHVMLLVDPLIYSLKLTGSRYNVIAAVDRHDRDWLREKGFEAIFFLPHAADREDFCPVETERPLDVVFIGSCYDHERIRQSWSEKFPQEIAAALNDGAERVLADGSTSLAEALFASWRDHRLSLEGWDMAGLCQEMDYYLRGKDRFELITSLKGVELHVFGQVQWDTVTTARTWQDHLASNAGVRVHPAVPYEEALRLLRHAKVCLNSSPFFKEGTHERVFNGMMSGCVVATNRTELMEELFLEGKEALFYDADDRESLAEKIKRLLNNEPERQILARGGQEEVLAHHTWDQRVDTILQEVAAFVQRLLRDSSA